MMRLGRHWFAIHFIFVVLGLSIAIFFEHIVDFTHNFFRVMITFISMTLTVAGLVGMGICIKDNYRVCKSSKYISRSK